MQIAGIETIPYALPFREPYVTARGVLERRELLLVRIHTDEGPVGIGEAVALSLRGGDRLDVIDRGLRRSERRLRKSGIADFAGPEPLRAAIDTFVHAAAGRRIPAPATAALEIAIFDLAGKVAGLPLWKLLRADRAEPVRCNATLSAATAGDVAVDAARWAERGFETFKLKLGLGDDVARARAVRAAVGSGARLRVDANGAWRADAAISILRELEPLGIELAEQPVAKLREMASVAAATSVPLAADESVTGASDARKAARAGACELATVKLAKVGGIGEAAAIASVLPIYLSSALDGPVGIAAAAHAAQAIYRDSTDPGLAHGLATQLLFADTIASRECEVGDGLLRLPEGPGLGVEIDEAALARRRL
ncbi:MAG TPA: mandelate racemase/muconate lactonizing enzyme family protein [Solirubrobacterales bacterium]|nr:mandelate racemase/muconate lactonizing enzyme family protein [Solirubrobacterales bacterium]